MESHLFRKLHPEDAGWTLNNLLLAAAVDSLRWLQWVKTKDGQKNRGRPDPIARPGVARARRVQPKLTGGPRSVVRKMLGRSTEQKSKAQRLSEIFSGKGGD